MSKSTCGVVILAHQTEKSGYAIREPLSSLLKSIRKHEKEHTNICIVTHQAKWLSEMADLADSIVEFKFGDAGYTDGNTLKNMYQLWHCTPWERNLVLSADMLVLQDLSEVLEALRGQRLVFASKSKTYNNNPIKYTKLVDVHEKLNLSHLLTDIWYFEKEHTQEWFDLLGLYSANWDMVKEQLGTYAPDNYDHDVLVSLVTDILDMNDEVKDLGILEYTDMSIYKEWPKSLNYWIKPNLIKIENFAVGGLVHLSKHGPFREIVDEY